MGCQCLQLNGGCAGRGYHRSGQRAVGLPASCRPHPEPRGNREGLCLARKRDARGCGECPCEGHTDYARPRKHDARETQGVPRGAGRTRLGSRQTHRHSGELSRPEGQRELQGTAGAARRHGKSHQRSPQQVQCRRAELQPRHPLVPEEHPRRTVRLRQNDKIRG